MKRQRHRFRIIALLLICCFLGLGVWGGWSVLHYGSRWFAHGSNTRLSAQKAAVTEGDIEDRNGILLATTAEGERTYRETSADRAALVHLIGDRNHQIANTVESFQVGYLYGYQSSLLDAVHHLIRKTERKGNSLTLTVDADLCSAAVRAFDEHPLTQGKSGAAVVLNYETGELLALISRPNFDPDAVTEEIVAALDQPYWNRATQALYPPGSTFKIVTAAACAEADPAIADRVFTCTGSLPVTDTFSVRDFNGAVHGELTLKQAFLHSCNCIFAERALALGNASLRGAAERFGFNRNFLFRDLVVSNSLYPAGEQAPEALAASGYGQSAIAATPLHMCLVAAAIANGGVMPEPRLLKTVKASSGAVILPWSSGTVGRVCDGETAAMIQEMMRDVVRSGSGSRAAVSTLDVRGKTGTAESTVGGRKINYGWFVGYNALKDLPFALCVLVEDIPEGETGGTTAALLAGDLFTYLKNHPDRVI